MIKQLSLTAILVLSGLTAGAQLPSKDKKSDLKVFGDETKSRFSKANPEDITDKNFPDLIESFDYPNADIMEVVKAIAKLTGKNFIIDPKAANGKITIIAPSSVTVAGAWRAFLSALSVNRLTVVPSGSFLKIRPIRDAATDSIETYTNYFPNTDQMITRIVKLKYINAEEVKKQIQTLKSQYGKVDAYGPTNSLIFTDLGSSIERIMSIINQLDVPGFEEQLAVIRITHAKAKDISDLIDKIINKDSKKGGRFSSRFSRNKKGSSSGGTSESYSFVEADDRTNSIVVMGNKAGIKRIRGLVSKLDFRLRPEDAGGVYVYYVRHGEAEKIAAVLGGLASDSKKSSGSSGSSTPRSGGTSNSRSNNNSRASESSGNIFGGDVKVNADKDTNSLIVTASKPDYAVVKSILQKIDIARDQVNIKSIILEMNASNNFRWGSSLIKFDEASQGRGRVGYNLGGLDSLTNPQAQGTILGFPSGDAINVATGAGAEVIQLPSLLAFVNFIKNNAAGNILSSPEIIAMDNAESEIEVGQEIPIGRNDTVAAGGATTSSIERKKATIKLTVTPYISPDTDSLRLDVNQQISQLSQETVRASELSNASVVTNERALKTSLNLASGQTAVLGGLMQDQEEVSTGKVPLLGDIPIIGWLFKSRQINKTKRNLMLFITPTIIRSESDSQKLLNSKINERIDFIQKHMRGRDPHGSEIDSFTSKNSGLEEEDDEAELEEPATESF